MARLFVLGTYNPPASSFSGVDLIRYLGAVGTPPAGVVFKSGAAAPDRNKFNVVVPVRNDFVAVQVEDFNSPPTVEVIRSLQADLLVYAGGRDLLRAPLLAASRLGCIGGHYGCLPYIRGMATVEWSVLLERHPPTVAIQRINPGIDTGEILMQARVYLRPGDTFARIRERSYFMTKVLLALAAQALLSGRITGRPQEIRSGRQYYRMHPFILGLAERALNRKLEAVHRRGAQT